jgi:thiamine biosynthesis lipoprotein
MNTPHRDRAYTPWAAGLALLLVVAVPVANAAPGVQTSFHAFGADAEIEVRDLSGSAGDEAMRDAVKAVAAVERLSDITNPESPLALLNAAAGKGRQPVSKELAEELERGLEFCQWSERRHGPLGAAIYELARAGGPLDAARLEAASDLTDCRRLEVDRVKQTANLAKGSRLDLYGFAPGLAVDDAIAALRAKGAANAMVRIGAVWRAMGGGADGSGWWITLPALAGSEAPPERVHLRDQALVAVRRDVPGLGGGAPGIGYFDGRSGRPAEDTLAVFAVTALAANALPLAITSFIAGSRQGELLLGSVSPAPSVLWAEGSGTGEPLFVPRRWADVTKR